MLEPTSEEFKQEVCLKYNTSLKQVQQDVKILREWIGKQPHLPKCSSDTLLTTFLIACKNSLERAKEKIDNYYTARSEVPDFFGDRDPEDERARNVAEEVRIFCLPKMTPDGCRVRMALLVTGDVSKYDISAFCKRALAYEDLKFNLEPFTMGDYLVVDCKGYTGSHLLRLTPTFARDFMYCVQDVMPVIVKGVFFINASSYVEFALNVIKPFIKKKVLERIHVHTEGPEALEKYFPRKLLPRDYGGEEDTSEKLHENWNNLLREKRDWLMGEGAATVDENKRVGSPRKQGGFQEMQGSFKTLCVD